MALHPQILPWPFASQRRLPKGSRLPSSNVSLTPVGASGATLHGTGNIDQSAVLYANTQEDTDTTVKAMPSGFETNTLLRSVSSPERLHFHMSLPAGATLAPIKPGAGAARVIENGETVAVIPTPTAEDAEGAKVPVSASVSGRTIHLAVAHRGHDYRYPIVVDPTVIDTTFAVYGETNWRAEHGGEYHIYPTMNNESHVWKINLSGFYKANEWGAVVYPTQGESHIYALSMESSGNGVPENVENHMVVMNSSGWESSLALLKNYVRTTNLMCVAAGCASSGGTAGNVAAYWTNATGTWNGVGTLEGVTMYAGSVYIAQNNGPSASFDTTHETLSGGKRNVLYGSGSWIREYEGAAEVNMSNPGVGVVKAVYTVTGGAKWTKKTSFCGPVQCSATTSQQVIRKNFNAEGSQVTLPDGEPTVEAQVFNGMGSTVTTSAKLKVDNTAPTAVSLTGLPESGEISDSYRALKLTAKATDGAGSVVSSGVASFKLAVDGQEVGSPNGSCSPGPCTASGEWSVDAEDYGAGKHVFTLTATDGAGNVTQSETPFTVHHATPSSFGPGTINPVTGDFDLEESDLSITTAGPPLRVTRNYDSREPTAGAEGPLGAPWSISIGGAQKLERRPSNKNMILTSASGGLTTFVYKSPGHYDSPTGDKNLILTANAGETEYTLANQGATTTFAHTSGDAENVWRPAIATGTGGTSTTQYTYQVVAGVAEPSQELAPVPAGVSCVELKRGCRALTFKYATSTTATGEGPSEWGDYSGRLTKVNFTAYEPVSKEMTTKTVAQYSYDKKGRLRASWDPRISPSLKTTFAYDVEGHVTSASPPGEEPWILTYGTTSADTSAGRLVAAGRPVASTALGSGIAPVNSGAPGLATTHPSVGKALAVAPGTWSNSPLRYAYQWERCNSSGGACAPIGGAINREYTPKESDSGATLLARVTATNAGGAATAATSISAVVTTIGGAAALPLSEFGSLGTGNGQLKAPWGVARDSKGNVWVADTANNRIEEFDSAGNFVRVAGTSGSGALSAPEGIAVDSSANVWVVDTGKTRVVEFNSTGTYVRAVGSSGTGNGQFKAPSGITIDEANHVWVVDSGNSRLQEFSSVGAFMKAFGTAGTGNGQLKTPGEASIDSKGNIWVADTGNSRVQEFSSEGAYVKKFGSSGSGNGQFCSAWGLAVDPNNDQVWVADACNNRVQAFSATGEFVQAFGASGSGSGQFNAPEGIAFSLAGYVYVLDKGNNRVTKWSDGAPTPTSEFGSLGSENGQLKTPWGVARDSSGNVWVGDVGNNRIEEFDSTGKFVRTAGTSGSGALTAPEALAVDSSNNVWVTDTGKNRVVEFNSTGTFVRAFGSTGSGAGQFDTPWGIAIDNAGHVWVSDSSNCRLEEFNSEGVWIRSVGKPGEEEGYLAWPGGVATDSKADIWVADPGNNRVTEYNGEGVYIRQFGSLGTGNGQFKNGPWGIDVDPSGHVWASDWENNRVEVFSETGAFIGKFGQSGSGVGQFAGSGAIDIAPTGDIYVSDQENNRVEKWSGASYWEGVGGSGETAVPVSATSTIEYSVPVSGTGAPYAMSSSDVANWAQTDVPVEATAFFPPDEPQAWPASDYKRATVDYLDASDRLVNVTTPGGATETSEYNSYNDVTRTLSADNRATALKEGAKSAETAQTLDTQSTYGSEGTELLSTLGPLHSAKLASGASVSAREHTVYSYDENAPSGGPYRLVTKVVTGAQIAGEAEADIRTTTKSYAGQNNLGWVLHRPTTTRIDPTGLKLTHTTVYDATSGNITETRTPAAARPAKRSLGLHYRTAFGSLGSSNGQVSKPGGVAVDKEGNVWVADTENNRVEEFSSGARSCSSSAPSATATAS